MTSKELQRMRRLEIENAELKEKIGKHMRVYGDCLIEICEMRARLELCDLAINGEEV